MLVNGLSYSNYETVLVQWQWSLCNSPKIFTRHLHEASIKVFYKKLILFPILLLPVVVFAKSDVEKAGDALVLVLPAAAFSTALFHDDWTGGVEYAKSLATTLGVTVVLKESVTKTRPNGDPQSFPSGHSASAFSAATFMQNRYGWRYGVPAYATAAFVGWSRVDSDKHYWEDVAAGAAIGALSSYYFTTRFGAKTQASVELMPGEFVAHVSMNW